MKPNSKKSAVRSVLFTLGAILLAVVASSAETARGTFNLQNETCWGSMLLKPGEYEFTVDLLRTGNLIIVRSANTRSAGMILPMALSRRHEEGASSIMLSYSDGIPYVRSVYLSDSDLELEFAAPKAVKLTKLARQTELATVSGTN